jgi:hypothetical protein
MDETMLSQVDAVPMDNKTVPENAEEEDTPPSSNDAMDIDAKSQEKTQLENMFDDDDEDFPSSNEAVPL